MKASYADPARLSKSQRTHVVIFDLAKREPKANVKSSTINGLIHRNIWRFQAPHSVDTDAHIYLGMIPIAGIHFQFGFIDIEAERRIYFENKCPFSISRIRLEPIPVVLCCQLSKFITSDDVLWCVLVDFIILTARYLRHIECDII